MSRRFFFLVLQLTLAASVVNAGPASRSTSPAVPLIFWGHYMPMVPHGHLAAHPYTGGNHDAWPFCTQYVNRVEECKEDIRQALESGINGFQMLLSPSETMYEAARQIREETGETFFVAPLWLDPRNVQKSADMVEKFQRDHAQDPHLFRIDGDPLNFVWNVGTDERIASLAEELKKRGQSRIVLAPTLIGSKGLKQLVDAPDWPDASIWKASVAWMHSAPEPADAEALKNKLVHSAKDFFYVPAVAAGYDSSNRTGQAIHTPFNGVKTLLQSLKIWVGQGFRQLTLVTWNDPHESLEIPSSRNIWGHNLILKYFHGIADHGQSPLREPQAVVSYPAELIQGDRLYFQVVGLPPANLATEWRAEVAFVPIGAEGNGKPFVVRGSAQSGANQEALIEMFWNASGECGSIPAVQPVVKVEYRPEAEAKWSTLYRDKKLPPIRLSYNLVQFPVPYAIDLSRIAETPSFKLEASASQPLDRAVLRISGQPEDLRRVMLCEQSRSLGAFRESAPEKGVPYPNVYVRIEASEDLPLTLDVSQGTIADFYSPNRLLEQTTEALNQSMVTFNARPPGGEYRTRVARMNLHPDAALSLTLASDPKLGITGASLAALKNGVVKTVMANGHPVTLGMILTTDATEPLVDFPVSEAVVKRALPLLYAHQEPRLLFAMGLLKNEKVVLSQPVWFGAPSKDPSVPVQWIETKGTFDAFVDPSSPVSLNPFTKEDIRTGLLPKSAIPFFYLGFEEGAGARLNDRGTSQQAGRAFIAPRNLSREEAFEDEANGRYKWLSSGYKGHALQLGGDTVIRFRSKSAPVGAETLSVWVEVNQEKNGDGNAWSTLQARDFQLTLNGTGGAILKFSKGGVDFEQHGELPLETGWNHLAFVYDLASIRFYHNGREIIFGEVSKPAYQRTHQTPAVGFAASTKNGPGFTGAIDELQVIGTGIDATAVRNLAKGQVWR